MGLFLLPFESNARKLKLNPLVLFPTFLIEGHCKPISLGLCPLLLKKLPLWSRLKRKIFRSNFLFPKIKSSFANWMINLLRIFWYTRIHRKTFISFSLFCLMWDNHLCSELLYDFGFSFHYCNDGKILCYHHLALTIWTAIFVSNLFPPWRSFLAIMF